MSTRIGAVEMIRLQLLRTDRLRPVAPLARAGRRPGMVLFGRTGEADVANFAAGMAHYRPPLRPR